MRVAGANGADSEDGSAPGCWVGYVHAGAMPGEPVPDRYICCCCCCCMSCACCWAGDKVGGRTPRPAPGRGPGAGRSGDRCCTMYESVSASFTTEMVCENLPEWKDGLVRR